MGGGGGQDVGEFYMQGEKIMPDMELCFWKSGGGNFLRAGFPSAMASPWIWEKSLSHFAKVFCLGFKEMKARRGLRMRRNVRCVASGASRWVRRALRLREMCQRRSTE